MRALVTGGGGFLGRYISEQLLARGDQVRVFSRQTYPALGQLGAELRAGDLRDPVAVQEACQGIDCVFHVAAVAGIWGRWGDFYAINTLGTQHVLEACQQQGVGRLVYTSSPSVTFDGRDQRGVDETAPLPTRWLAHYPKSKALAETAVLQADSVGGVRTCALRPHLVWGPRDPHLVPRLWERARQGQLRRVGDGTNLIDVTYVENAAEAHLLAADALAREHSPVAGRAYFLSQGEPVNCWQWIDELLQLAGLPRVDQAVSLRAAVGVGHLLEWVQWLTRRRGEPRMTRFLALQLGTSHFFDISRAQRDFGYQPRISTAEGMRRLAATLCEPG